MCAAFPGIVLPRCRQQTVLLCRPTRAYDQQGIPAWQFLPAVPDQIAPVLELLDDMPGNEIHAFCFSEADQLNAMAPAEMLAGMPISTRQNVHSSQRTILCAPTHERARRLTELAEFKLRAWPTLLANLIVSHDCRYIARAATMPPRDLLRQVLASNIIELSTISKLIRVAWSASSVSPDRVTRTYRFGPSSSFRTALGFPSYWIYAAEEILT